MSSKLKLLTIREAEKADDSQLYLLNRMNPVGNVNITVTTENGERRTVTLPIASVPIDATTQATKGSILSNPDFRRIHARNGVQIVDTESAEQLFKNNQRARDELERIFTKIGDPSTDLGAPTISNVAKDSTIIDVGSNQEISPFVMNIVERAENDESISLLLSELDSRIDTLAIDELQYIVSHSSESKLKEWASEAITLREDDE